MTSVPLVIYLRNKETQQTLQFILSIQCDVSSVDDAISWKQYVSVKLQQLKPIRRLCMPAVMRIIILALEVNY